MRNDKIAGRRLTGNILLCQVWKGPWRCSVDCPVPIFLSAGDEVEEPDLMVFDYVTLEGRYHYSPHFADVNTEASGSKITC